MAPRSSIDVFLRLHGQRKFAKELAASGAELEAMGLKGAKAMARFAASGERLKRFGRSWTHNVSLPVAALGVVAGKMSVDFHQAMSLIQTQAGASARETQFLEKHVLKMAKNSKFGPEEMADALFRVRSAGFKAKEALDVLQQGRNLSTMGNSDLEMTTKALTGAAKSLDLEKPGQLKGLAAEMNAIVGTGDMRMEELQDALSSGVLPAFVSAGLGMRDFGSALTVMTDRNVPAAVAATRLRMAVSLLSAPTDKAAKALKGVGLGSATLAEVMRHKGLPAAVEVLAKHLDTISKTEANQVLTEAFGGAKSSSTIKMLVENVSEMPEKWDLIAAGVGKYNKQLKIAENQPGTKLAKAWSSIQVSLVELGDQLLPVAVPAFEKLATVFESVAHSFLGLPGEVQAAAIGFLLLTGPVASGLGYFASGLGKLLVLTNGVAKFGRVFSASMAEAGYVSKLTVSSSFAEAWRGTGASAALQTAKGFAYSLGPAVAAYGIGNIVTSATSGDWRDAGFEAGGALAGGIAGFALTGGNPLGAMLGVGIGSLGGELLSGFLSSAPKVSKLHKDLDHLSDSTKGYREALKGLPSAEETVKAATERHSKAVHQEHQAQRALARTLGKFGAATQPATEAQIRLDKWQRRVAKSAREERNAHRLAGNALKVYRMRSLEKVASLKQVLPQEAKLVKTLNRRLDKEPHNLHLAERTLRVERALSKHKRELTEAYAQAESKAGKPWTKRLQSLTTLQAQYGRKGKVLVTRLSEQRSKLAELTKAGYKQTPMWAEVKSAIGETLAELDRFQRQTEGETPARRGPGAAHHGPAGPQRPHPRRHGKGGARAGTSSLRLPPRPRKKLDRSGLSNFSDGVIQIEITNDNRLHIDGEEVARNTTRQSKKAAARG